MVKAQGRKKESIFLKENNLFYLRPSFTKYLIKRLKNGESINLFGDKGVGKSRLLLDIKKTKMQGIKTVLVSFVGYQYSYDGFCSALCHSAEIEGEPVKNFKCFLEKVQNIEGRVIILIDGFEKFPSNPNLDTSYNQEFIDNLNAIKDLPNISLMIVTESPLNTFVVFINKIAFTSTLNLTPIKITEIQIDELREEIERRLKDTILSSLEKESLVSG